MKRFIATGAALSTAAALTLIASPPAFAEASDGTITVRVVTDVNRDGTRNAGDTPFASVDVTVTSASGDVATGTTNAAGTFVLTGAASGLTGGQYRIEVENPDPTRYTDAQIVDGHAEPQLAPTVSFVDVRGGAAANVSVGFIDTQAPVSQNPRIYSAIHPDSVWGQNADDPELYSIDYNLTESGPTRVTDQGTLGTVYGIGIDPISGDVFAGAYAKRGSAYGPGGAGAIYRVDPTTGANSVWVTVADVGETAHNITQGGLQDFDFIPAVGRESLGDLDVTPDGRWLTVVNMHTDSLVVYPVQSGANPAPVQTLPVAVPDGVTCASDWAPMGLEEHDGSLYVGAVCGSTLQAVIMKYDRAANGTLSFDGVVMNSDLTSSASVPGRNGVGQAILISSADCFLANWRTWADTLPQTCIDTVSRETPAIPTALTHTPQFSVPQPELADMEFLDDGRMVVSFRDRSGDLYGPLLYVGQKTNGNGAYVQHVHAGDALFACPSGGTFTLACGNPFEVINDANVHPEGAYGGIAYNSGAAHFVTNQMDPTGLVDTSGLRRNNITSGASSNGVVLTTDSFQKSAGLADIEVAIEKATQQIGNRVWLDLDRDGIQDPDEPVIPGVQVSLYDGDTLIARTETDALGEYYFDTADGLLPDTAYEIRLDRPADYTTGGPLAGLAPTLTAAGSDTDVDSNGAQDGTIVTASITSPADGFNDHSFDFGFAPIPVSIGDYVWLDLDGDGVQDSGEPAVPGVTVTLLDADGNEIGTDVTDADGYYTFTDLRADTAYTVVFPTTVQVDGDTYVLTTQEQTSSPNGSNPDPATGQVPVVTPASGDNLGTPDDADDPTIDAGYRPLVSVGDYLWIDENENGVQDADESPVPAGTPVRLLTPDGDEVATTTTDANGYYVFTDLPGGTDFVIEFPRSVEVGGTTYPLTTPDSGGDDAADSDADQSSGQVAITTPVSGSNSAAPGEADDPTIDAGYFPNVVSIGDFVWIDADRDGVQDAGETPVAGTTVNLLSADGETVVATTTTDAEGFYFFANLPPSTDYIVEFPTTVTVGGITYSLTTRSAGDDTAVDSNPAVDTGRAPVTTPAEGDNLTGHGQTDDPTIDAGYISPIVSIGDYVWIDTDRDGVQDTGETPVAGATVNLLSADGETVVATTTTDANGYYAFTDLPPGTDYIVEFPTTVTVDGVVHTLTAPGSGTAATDSNPAVATGRTPVTTPLTGNNSGAPGEADDPTIDAGYVPVLVSIGDYVWIDADRDGIQDAGEAPVPNVPVRLIDADGDVVATTVTDANGYYAFTDLPNSTDFVVEFPTTVVIGGLTYQLTTPSAGGDDAADSNAAVATGQAPVTTPASGNNSGLPGEADDPTIDAGYMVPAVSIGDYVWIDIDRDGVQDADEKPVPGATVQLQDADGNVLGTTTTDADGYYAFTGLEPNTDYQVAFPTTVVVDGVNYVLTTPTAGGDAAADSNPDASGVATVTTPLSGNNSGAPGDADDPTIDAGYVPVLVSIGDYVWIDTDGDGVQDAGEAPVPNVPVRLLDTEGNEVATTTTDANGYYAFTDLPNSTDFIVEFPRSVSVDGHPHGLTTPGAGSDAGADSNPQPTTGRTPVTTPATGSNSGAPGQADDPTVDAGYAPTPLVSVGDYVWIDSDGDGVRDPGEKPVPGVTVTLLDADGNVVATTTTDPSGWFSFTDLLPSTEYAIQFPTTVTVDGVEYPLTASNRGDDEHDSDADPKTGLVTFVTPASGSNSGLPGDTDLLHISAGYTPPAPALAVTGGTVPWLVGGLAVLLLLAGGALLVIRRRRAATAAAEGADGTDILAE